MQLHTCMLSALTLGTAMSFGIAGIAADLPKEGSYKGFYAAVGTIKTNSVGKDRSFESFDETGLEVTGGFLDHTTWRCWGIGDFENGMGGEHGQCIGTDPDGDKIIQSFVSEKHAPDQKSWVQTLTCTGGTGKFVGVTCNEKDTIRSNEFPPAPEGTYVNYVTIEGTYKLK